MVLQRAVYSSIQATWVHSEKDSGLISGCQARECTAAGARRLLTAGEPGCKRLSSSAVVQHAQFGIGFFGNGRLAPKEL